jgi:hypothetical protein
MVCDKTLLTGTDIVADVAIMAIVTVISNNGIHGDITHFFIPLMFTMATMLTGLRKDDSTYFLTIGIKLLSFVSCPSLLVPNEHSAYHYVN